MGLLLGQLADALHRDPALSRRAVLRAAGLRRGEGMRQTLHERTVQRRDGQLCVPPRLGWGPMPALRRALQVPRTHRGDKASSGPRDRLGAGPSETRSETSLHRCKAGPVLVIMIQSAVKNNLMVLKQSCPF